MFTVLVERKAIFNLCILAAVIVIAFALGAFEMDQCVLGHR